MIISKIFLIFAFATSIVAQNALSPTDCVIACVDLILESGVTDCVGPKKTLDPTKVPCLCEDLKFMKATVECVLNSGRCRDDDTVQRSFIYARGLCDSAGVDLPGNSGSDLPSVYGVSTSVSGTSTSSETPTPILTVVDEIVTTMISRPTSIACPIHSGNVTYIVMKSNTTYTTMPENTGGVCGNITETFEISFTKKVTSTLTSTASTTSTESMTATEQPTSTEESGGAVGSADLNSMGLLSFAGIVMWFF